VHVCLIDDTDKNDGIAFLITAIQLNYCNPSYAVTLWHLSH